jgi:hypothetical protein
MVGEREELAEQLARELGVEVAQGRQVVAHLATVGNAGEVRAYLASLLADTTEARALAEKAVRLLGAKARGAAGAAAAGTSAAAAAAAAPAPGGLAAAAPAAPSGSGKAKAQPAPRSTSPAKPSMTAAARIQVVRPTAGEGPVLITGNEAGIAGVAMQNCLDCGFIYRADKYAALSRCEQCNEPVGRAQLKKARELQGRQPQEAEAREAAALAAALAHRDKLLDFDASSAQRTVVYDDQADYFALDPSAAESRWASPAEREAAKADLARRTRELEDEASKRYVTIDLGRRPVVNDAALEGAAGDVYARIADALKR